LLFASQRHIGAGRGNREAPTPRRLPGSASLSDASRGCLGKHPDHRASVARLAPQPATVLPRVDRNQKRDWKSAEAEGWRRRRKASPRTACRLYSSGLSFSRPRR
jgi:hypothetical protein